MSVAIAPRQRWGLVGRNGTGKTTLLNVILGTLEPTRGTVVRPTGTRFSLLDQHRDFGSAATVWDAAAAAYGELIALEHSLHATMAEIGRRAGDAPAELLARYDRELERFRRADGYALEARVDAVLHGLGFDPAAARTQPLAQLSGGELGRVGLAAQLVAPADVLMLDEPTNHLDLETTKWLESWLLQSDATLLVISHDRAFLEAVADHILHFEAGTALPYAGGFSAFVEQRAQRRLTEERAFAQQQKAVAEEEDYIRRNIAGQNSRQAKGRRTRLARLPRLSPPVSEERSMALRLEPEARGGDQVLVAEEASVQVAERTLIRSFTTRVQRGEIVGLLGLNGSGKSSLLRVIAGERSPAGGTLRLGASITVAYYRQDLTQVPTERTLFQIIHDLRPLWNRGQVHGHLARFGFSGELVERSAGVLSGGERARVALAMLMLTRANLLLLDEPTNHLDVESIEALEDAILEFDGTIILVSHDRALLRGVATRVWHLDEQVIRDFPATFPEWEQAEEEKARARERARREEEAAAAARMARRAAPAAPRPGAPSLRALRHALEAAEQEVARLEGEAAALEAALADPALYADPAEGARRAGALQARREVVGADLAAAIAAWEHAAEILQRRESENS